jgi:hypothetical protein
LGIRLGGMIEVMNRMLIHWGSGSASFHINVTLDHGVALASGRVRGDGPFRSCGGGVSPRGVVPHAVGGEVAILVAPQGVLP